MKKYTIKELSEKTNIGLKKIRRLDNNKKFGEVTKTNGGHRRYTQNQLDLLIEHKNDFDSFFYNKESISVPKTAKRIKDSIEHWIDVDGEIYAKEIRDGRQPRIYKKSKNINRHNGYVYCGITYRIDGKYQNKSKRVHKLVAEAHILNDDKDKNIVGHRNNIKSDNRVENLYWTNASENTQKAVDDGLLVNDKGFDDSQSIPVNMYETSTNKFIESFGSISEASKKTGWSKSTISRQAKYKRPVRKEYYFRFIDDLSQY